jgi:hypothetical protein
MSVVVTVAAAGVIAMHSGALIALAASVAAGLGLKATQEGVREQDDERERLAGLYRDTASALEEASQKVEISTATRAALETVVAERCEATFEGDGWRLVLQRDIRGVLTVRAHGRGVDRVELHARASRFLGLLQQQIAYREVVRTLRQRGFGVAEEKRLEDGTVRVRVVKGA